MDVFFAWMRANTQAQANFGVSHPIYSPAFRGLFKLACTAGGGGDFVVNASLDFEINYNDGGSVPAAGCIGCLRRRAGKSLLCVLSNSLCELCVRVCPLRSDACAPLICVPNVLNLMHNRNRFNVNASALHQL